MLKQHKAPTSWTHFPQLTLDTITQTTTESPPQASYRATIDFRNLNRIRLSNTTAFLPSIQSVETSFGDSIVSTLDIENCYLTILIAPESRNYFDFYGPSNQVWTHCAVAQGWSPSLNFCQRALAWTFRAPVLEKFRAEHILTWEQLPFSSYDQFLISFVDDLAIYTPAQSAHTNNTDRTSTVSPHAIHYNCVRSVLYSIQKHGWKLSLQKYTFSNPIFIFLGLRWDLAQRESMTQNDRVESILSYRVPRSIAELVRTK